MKSYSPSKVEGVLRFLEFGNVGTPLIFLHGLGCSSSFEYPHVVSSSPLAGRRVLLVDLLGSGYSDRPVSFGYRIEDHAEVVAQFVEEFVVGQGFEKVDLFGHSMGGAVAIKAAILLGHRVENLILSEPNLDSGGGQFSRDIANGTETQYVSEQHQDIIKNAILSGNNDWAATMQTSSPLAVYRGAVSLVEGSSPCWRDQLYQHSANKCVIFGKHSFPDPDFDILAGKGISTRTVENAGHSMGLENPVGLAKAIRLALGVPALGVNETE